MSQFSQSFHESASAETGHGSICSNQSSGNSRYVSFETIDLSLYVNDYNSTFFIISGLPDGAYLINNYGKYCELQSGQYLDRGKMTHYQIILPRTVTNFEFEIILSEIKNEGEIDLTTVTLNLEIENS
jgi:hypothetical protein